VTGAPLAADAIDRASDELTDFSASRLTLAGKCGLAFEYQYVRKLPAPYETGAQMFGNAIHDGTQEWYGPDDANDNRHQERDLAPIVLAQWGNLLPPKIWALVQELRDLDEECHAVAAAVRFKRPEIKAATQTKEYLDSNAHKRFSEKRMEMVGMCDALPDVKWRQDEDPYKAYTKSAQIADEMQARWQHLPRPLAVERPFRIEIEGFVLRGRIDQVRMDPARGTGEAIPRMVDIKTGTQVMTPMEAFLQSFIYNEAIEADPTLPSVDGNIAFYLARHNKYQQGRIDRARHRRLALRILNGRARQITLGQFEPSYGYWCKRCDFADVCEREIDLWTGDGLVYDLLDRAT
jgi:PD-(D/E)XK nuclease superfamily